MLRCTHKFEDDWTLAKSDVKIMTECKLSPALISITLALFQPTFEFLLYVRYFIRDVEMKETCLILEDVTVNHCCKCYNRSVSRTLEPPPACELQQRFPTGGKFWMKSLRRISSYPGKSWDKELAEKGCGQRHSKGTLSGTWLYG